MTETETTLSIFPCSFTFFYANGKICCSFAVKKVKATAIYFELRQLWLGSVISQEEKFMWVQIKMFMIPGQFS